MTIYPTLKEAGEHRRGLEMIVEVKGGYALMTETTFRTWKNANRLSGGV